MGAPLDGGAAARAASRDLALYTSHFRLKQLLDPDAPPYPLQLRRLPRLLLAAAFLAELGHLGRRAGHSLRISAETFTEASALIGLLSFFDRHGRLKAPMDPLRVSDEVQPAVRALSALAFGDVTMQLEAGS